MHADASGWTGSRTVGVAVGAAEVVGGDTVGANDGVGSSPENPHLASNASKRLRRASRMSLVSRDMVVHERFGVDGNYRRQIQIDSTKPILCQIKLLCKS